MSLVLFDIDGTLLRRAGPHHKAALVEGIRRVTGLDTTLDGLETSGMLDRDLIAAMMRGAGATERQIRSGLRQIMTECQVAYADNCASDLRSVVCAGIGEALTRLRDRGATMGVVTGNLSQIGWKKLELAGLREFFSIGAFAEDGRSRARLARVAFWRAVRNGFSRREKVTLIGDHLNDIEAAQANGFQSVAVGTGVLPLETLRGAHPDFAVSDLTELSLELLL